MLKYATFTQFKDAVTIRQQLRLYKRVISVTVWNKTVKLLLLSMVLPMLSNAACVFPYRTMSRNRWDIFND